MLVDTREDEGCREPISARRAATFQCIAIGRDTMKFIKIGLGIGLGTLFGLAAIYCLVQFLGMFFILAVRGVYHRSRNCFTMRTKAFVDLPPRL